MSDPGGGIDDLWVVDTAGDAPAPVATGADEPAPAAVVPDAARGARRAAVAAIAIVALLAGYLVGFARGSADLERGSAGTTSIVALPPEATTAPPTITTAPPSTTAAVAGLEPPAVALTTLAFDDGLPTSVAGADLEVDGSWTARDGALASEPVEALPADRAKPRLLGTGPAIRAVPSTPPIRAAVRLVAPTAHSSLVLGDGAGSAWQLGIAPDLGRLLLIEVRGEDQQQRAFVDVALAAGTEIGLYLLDGRVGVSVDGQARTVQSFFGPADAVDAAGIVPTEVAVVASDGELVIDDLSFG